MDESIVVSTKTAERSYLGYGWVWGPLVGGPGTVAGHDDGVQGYAYISKTRGSCPVLSSAGQYHSIHSEGPPVECCHSTIPVSIVCPSVLKLSQYP